MTKLYCIVQIYDWMEYTLRQILSKWRKKSAWPLNHNNLKPTHSMSPFLIAEIKIIYHSWVLYLKAA